MLKPPTAKQVDDACRNGVLVVAGKEQRELLGAVTHRNGEVTLKGRIWVHMADDLSWHYVPADSVTITDQKMKGFRMPQGKGRDGAISHIAPKARQKAGDKSKPPIPEAKGNGATDDKKKTTVTVSRSTAKQGELPGVQTSKRKIQEIEDLAELLEEKQLEKKRADEAHKDAEENLIASMRRHDRTYYSRSTWGKVELKEPQAHAKFKREKEAKAKAKAKKK